MHFTQGCQECVPPPPSLNKPKIQTFIREYQRANSVSGTEFIHDPEDLIVEQNFGDSSKCRWVRKRKNDNKDLIERRKRFHLERKKERDILNAYCNE